MSVIKKGIQPITLPLTAIVNMSFQTGVFPSSTKLAKNIIPVFKSGSKEEFNKYRPISLLSQFSKILDLKKAVDNVNHSILLQKLNFYVICGVAEKWIESYLSDRKQFVKICDSSSNALGVSCGVPQGSVLGPRFLILYINDMQCIKNPQICVICR